MSVPVSRPASSRLTILNGGSAILVEGGLSWSFFRGASKCRHLLPSAIASRLPSALYRDRLSRGATAALADGLAALLDTLEIDRTNLLGSSLAGYWLQTFGSAPPADQIADPGRHVSRVPRSAQPSAVLDPNPAGRGRRSSQTADAFPIASPGTGSVARPADLTFASWPKRSVVAGAAACGGDSAARPVDPSL